MNKKQKDEICAMWIKVFGTQEGVGMNCPAGAYKFAKLVMKFSGKRRNC